MAFATPILTLIGLLKLELPGGTIRLCDGGFCDWQSERYTAEHPVWGSIAAIEPVDEGVGDMAPGGTISFAPATDASASALSSRAHAGARLRGWLGEIGPDAKTVTAARPLFDGLIDTTTMRLGRGTRLVEMSFIARAERLFLTNQGNTLSPRFHKSVWPGEAGFNNATGVPSSVAWGIEAAPQTTTYGGSGGFAGSFVQAVKAGAFFG